MTRLIILIMGLLLFFISSNANAGEEYASAAAELQITVKILDFKTTKRICGQAAAPDWCPSHLRRQDVAVMNKKSEGGAIKLNSFNMAQIRE